MSKKDRQRQGLFNIRRKTKKQTPILCRKVCKKHDQSCIEKYGHKGPHGHYEIFTEKDGVTRYGFHQWRR